MHSSNAMVNLTNYCFPFVSLLQNFELLTEIHLQNSKFLKQVPDVSGASNFKKINISDCQNLTEVHDSVGFLDKLVSLVAWRCKNLCILPRSIKSAFLQELDFSDCFRLQGVPEIFGVIENNLTTPYLDYEKFNVHYLNYERFIVSYPDRQKFITSYGCHALVLSKSLGALSILCDTLMLPKLEKLSPAMSIDLHISVYDGFRNERHFPPTFDLDCHVLRRPFSTRRPYYRSLQTLDLNKCNLTDEFLYQLSWFPNIKSLDVICNKFTVLPECVNECRYLETLFLDGCKDLREIKGIPPKIKVFSAVECILLTSQSSRKLLSQVRFISPHVM